MKISREILAYLFNNKEFKQSLTKGNWLCEEELAALRRYAEGIDKEHPQFMQNFFDWLNDVFFDRGDLILEIAYDSDCFSPMGNGYIRFQELFGLVKRFSSVDVDDHVEIFNKDTFEPWGDNYINTGYVDIYSNCFDDEYLLAFAREIVIPEEAVVTINDKLIER